METVVRKTCATQNGCSNPPALPGMGPVGFDAAVAPGSYNFYNSTGLALGKGDFSFVAPGVNCGSSTDQSGPAIFLNPGTNASCTYSLI